METSIYIALFVLFVICGYLLYQHVQLERRVKEQDKAHKKALADAGSAITDTLKIAFDNLKKNSSEHNKVNNKLTEHTGRIHRLEQQFQRTRLSEEAATKTFPEEIKNERRKPKTS